MYVPDGAVNTSDLTEAFRTDTLRIYKEMTELHHFDLGLRLNGAAPNPHPHPHPHLHLHPNPNQEVLRLRGGQRGTAGQPRAAGSPSRQLHL